MLAPGSDEQVTSLDAHATPRFGLTTTRKRKQPLRPHRCYIKYTSRRLTFHYSALTGAKRCWPAMPPKAGMARFLYVHAEGFSSVHGEE